jgi:hypothetical protein
LARAWHWLTTSRYTRRLEAEVERLRTENAGLREAIYARAGLRITAAVPKGDGEIVGSTEGRRPEEAPRAIRRLPWGVMRQRLEIEDARRALAERQKGKADDAG